MPVRWIAAGACLLGGMLALGCGGGEGTRYRVSGTVKFAGQPVKKGRVYFDPDGKENKDAQQGYADIKEGKYDTADGGKGSSGGKYTVRIEGFGDPTEAYQGGVPLFETYSEKRDLPKADTTEDFNVPIEAKAKLLSKPPPAP